MKRTLKERISDLEQQQIVLNGEERLKEAERFMKDVRDGKYYIIPSKRYEALEEKLGITYEVSSLTKGKYEKKKNTN